MDSYQLDDRRTDDVRYTFWTSNRLKETVQGAFCSSSGVSASVGMARTAVSKAGVEDDRISIWTITLSVTRNLCRQSALRDFISELMGQPLDLSHPLWNYYLVENYGAAAPRRQLHHCLADGMAWCRCCWV
jgi:hypothetical protein